MEISSLKRIKMELLDKGGIGFPKRFQGLQSFHGTPKGRQSRKQPYKLG